VFIPQDRTTRAEHVRAVPVDQNGKRHLGRLTVARRKSLQQLSVRQSSTAAFFKQ
jgi:hypothetical protein